MTVGAHATQNIPATEMTPTNARLRSLELADEVYVEVRSADQQKRGGITPGERRQMLLKLRLAELYARLATS